ncbi:hypothetical protein AB4455_02840 [Vibrio sp. 10N.261.46.E12]|uniref:hypothetical protein n=1 Tax=unclassified Vibrio TaxID=2614977 RepID=UPI0009764FC6|nr:MULTISPECIES: hypothetical protein [unclassified Vibrio]OMO33339.1 hypothetical protein BH584_15185 [Vibrio sp. 10N.261.45.E1]PMJ27815.1 hypothetical protein BCU27_06390 [Vibrio sp. 10N.286.45.B6]PML88126.1 hypothetical protein BCT66_11050 [Vibrio sp. 10N.261.49.E11]PMM67454.1 hypothetical protein BCT48_15525 [Vibrio sp. 10N.261.46.F12]PMM81663.1 hypothetical protein BCT46_14735 [Vibrio sp. 10N.261.46.E8]
MQSAWLNALSALDRRLHSQQLDLISYRALAYVHEIEGSNLERIKEFININDDENRNDQIINNLFHENYLKNDEDDPARIILTEIGEMVIDEIYRLCQSRLAKPLFTKPNY